MTKEEIKADIAKLEADMLQALEQSAAVQRIKSILAKVRALLHKETAVVAAATAPTVEAKQNDSQTPNGTVI